MRKKEIIFSDRKITKTSITLEVMILILGVILLSCGIILMVITLQNMPFYIGNFLHQIILVFIISGVIGVIYGTFQFIKEAKTEGSPKTAFIGFRMRGFKILIATWKVIVFLMGIFLFMGGFILMFITLQNVFFDISNFLHQIILVFIISGVIGVIYGTFQFIKEASIEAESTPSDIHYSRRKVMMTFTPMYYLLILVVIAFIYVGNVSRVIEVFIFTILIGIFLILPYLIFPIGCLILLFWVENFHIFTLNLLGITGDTFTLGITIFIAICYSILNTIVLSMTVLSIILVKIDTEKSLDLFTTIEKASLTKWYKRFREKYLN